MNIKSLLIGSAAALAAVSGAQAADAIVAAEPEAVEYVRVCDAYGTGFFYIPGTETCLQISGYVRIQADIGRDASDPSDYDVFARARVNFDARNDTELGTLRSFIQLRANTSHDHSQEATVDDGTNLTVEAAYIELGGFRIGKFYSWWDDSMKSESETVNNQTNFVSARYTYTADTFSVGLSVDELTWNGSSATWNGTSWVAGTADPRYSDANVGLTGMLSASAGGVKGTILGSYDFDYEEFAIRGIFSADVGPGTFELGAVYSSGKNTYYSAAEWTVAADYAFKATDKLTITPMAQYFWDYGFSNGNDAWRVGLTANYTIVKGLNLLATVGYTDPDVGTDSTSGFIRLQRDF